MRDAADANSLLNQIERKLPAMYLVLGLAIMGLLCFLTAPFFAPDEPVQACRAISLSHGNLIEHMGPGDPAGDEPGDEIDTGLVQAMGGFDDLRMAWEKSSPNFLDRPYGPVAEDRQRRLAGIRWSHRTMFLPFGNTAPYPPGLYLPAMAGLRAAEAIGLTIFQSLRLARLLCALTAVGLGWLALRLCVGFKWLLLPLLLLPSTLFLNASCSQDAEMLAVAALLVAVLSRPLAARREFTRAELAVTAILLALCAMARPPYLAMALVLFLPGMDRAGAWHWRRWLEPATAFAGVVAISTLWMALVARLGLEHSDAAEPTLQAAFLRAHPLFAARAVLAGTFAAAGDFAHRGLYVVGWNDLLPHHGASAVLAVCVVVLVLAAPGNLVHTWLGRGLLALAVAVPLLGISLAEYIIWTPPGAATVDGVQPRYWLPVIPLATMLLQGILGQRWSNARTTLLLGATALLAATACTLPWMAAHAFYDEGVTRVLELNLRW